MTYSHQHQQYMVELITAPKKHKRNNLFDFFYISKNLLAEDFFGGVASDAVCFEWQKIPGHPAVLVRLVWAARSLDQCPVLWHFAPWQDVRIKIDGFCVIPRYTFPKTNI